MTEPGSTDIVLVYFIGTFAMLLLAGAIFFFFIVYQKRLLQKELEINRIRAKQQKEILKNTVQAQEKERKRIARDLHDEVGAMLSVVKLNINRIEKKTTDSKPPSLVTETKSYLDEVIEQVRRISRDLMPPSLEKLGLSFALEDMVSWINKSDQIRIELSGKSEPVRFEMKKELAVFRIIQELINNALKHSKASHIFIKMRYTEKYMAVSVADNGIGFNLDELEKTGLGLKNLESRAELMGGQYKMKSYPGKGTFAVLKLDI